MEPSEYETIARLEQEHWWYVGMREIAAAWLGDIRLGPGARILDAGCGTGGGLIWLEAFGSPVGIDQHPLALQHSAKKSRRVARASIQSLPFGTAEFDLVASLDVLYHRAVTDDLAALREAARVLRPGGWLLLRVPAFDWLRRGHDRQVHSRHRYQKGELREKIWQAGLRLHRLSGVGVGLVPLMLLRRWTEVNTRPCSDLIELPGVLNYALARTLAAERYLLRRFNLPLGGSLLALARKP